ncbi:molybdenum cofactor guanylyltransferase [Burkholderiales bacterium]|nr:molybdenum cofactor guanylyltransferase [Burkholderiales bacterium]
MLRKGVTGVILAGGRGKRMGGKNKALIPFNNSTLIENAIEAIQPQVDEIIISANQDLLRLSKLGFPVIEDQASNQGPLIGIVSVAGHISTTNVVITPCDVINIPETYVQEMIFALESTKSDIVVAKTNRGAQHLNCAFKLSEIDDLKRIIEKGTLRVSAWQAKLKTSYVEFDRDQMDVFKNINEPQDIPKTKQP